MTGACKRVHGHEVINAALKSSPQGEPWGSGGVAPRKKTRPFERHASVVLWVVSSSRDRRACSSSMLFVYVRAACTTRFSLFGIFLVIHNHFRCVSGRTGALYRPEAVRSNIIIRLRVCNKNINSDFFLRLKLSGRPYRTRTYRKACISP